ncbi:TPA: CYTH domain-containing protein [Aeromonas veronii]|nr:CYTH domain-containing protein [Aeromonas veronii]
MPSKWYENNDLIIRDSVHGDIYISSSIIDVINSDEFQRLRRIKQLSVANMIFPSADHTRFSHSIGTYHVMRKIISHVEKQLSNINIDICERDKNLVLVAALLHDIGHGPFSHAFESVQCDKKHEEWTTDIIENNEGSINAILKRQFDNAFPTDVAGLIKKSSKVSDNQFYFEQIDLQQILSSLVSSQLDADRLDYLLRDSAFTGVAFGKIDLDRIISSIRVTEHNDKFCLCFKEKYVPDLESYLLARYQMSKGVYYHSFKIEMETIIKYIISRAKELFIEKRLCHTPKLLVPFFEGKMSVRDYLNLDDSVFTSAFISWKSESDYKISKLCECFIDRKKFHKISIINNEAHDIELFKKDLNEIYFECFNKNINFDLEYFWIQGEAKYAMYNTQKENIQVLCKNGKLKDISEVSHVLKQGAGKINDENYTVCFINNSLITDDQAVLDVMSKKIESIITTYDIKSHIEIEKKYSVVGSIDANLFFKNIVDLQGVEISGLCSKKNQIDTYYDTNKKELKANNESLRIRCIGDDKFITIKAKYNSADSNIIKGQNERIEYEEPITSDDINENLSFINKRLSRKVNPGDLVELVRISNNRTKQEVKFKNAIFEVSLDEFEIYSGNVFIKNEVQVEIELKSDYATKVLLKQFSDMLSKRFNNLHATSDTKLEIALKLSN